MRSIKLKLLIVLLMIAGVVIVAQASLQNITYLPVVIDQHGGGGSTATETSSQTPTETLTPSPTPVTPTPTDPLPTVQVNSLFEIELTGPASIGMGNPNPFMIEVEVTFTGPGGAFVVQGFYDGNGIGGMDGDVWKARFTPDKAGVWSYLSSSSEAMLDGHSGSFNAVDPTGCSPYPAGGLPDFDCTGRLEYAGNHYLRFDSGQYWFKGGVNDPEDFLRDGVTMGFASKEDAIDYLASKGSNSLYMLFNNVGGDGSNLYPWVGDNPTEARANHERYDVAKLAQWENIFDYLQSKGIVLHLVFEDDSGWTGFNRNLYYRQMIARFGHYNGLLWNVAEEFNELYTADEIKGFAQTISDLDPYDHPLTVHQEGVLSNWDSFVGDERFDLTSFQSPLTPLIDHNANAVTWYNNVETSGRPILVSFDEIRYIIPTPDPEIPPLSEEDSRHVIWGVFTGGANYELRIWPDDLYSYLDFEPHLEDLQRARQFMEQQPFWQMQPMNGLLEVGQGYVFAKTGGVYIVYLPAGGQIDLDLSGTTNTFNADWFNPRDGTYQAVGSITGGGIETFIAPDTNDWVLLLD